MAKAIRGGAPGEPLISGNMQVGEVSLGLSINGAGFLSGVARRILNDDESKYNSTIGENDSVLMVQVLCEERHKMGESVVQSSLLLFFWGTLQLYRVDKQ